ncbi:MAG: transcriptional repressor [Candidatus Tectomicrobia bacterium]|nr:transcriptional repressor [Candidatus Tectomicrobia bacterium]
MRHERTLFKRYISTRKLKFTRQRLAVLEAFLDASGHISIDELYQRLRVQHPGIGLATVYRTMRLVANSGLAVEQHFSNGETRYEAVRQHHDHMICTRCGAILEFFDKGIERLQHQVADREGFKITDHKMELYGVCASCQAGGPSAPQSGNAHAG